MVLPAALVPLQRPVFRGLWLAWLAANMTMWMNDVAAAWLMTSLTTSPVMVALVQTASTLPVFLLGLPSGAMADIVDRRLWFAGTQLWVSVNALVLAACSLAGLLTAPLLLGLTFVNGIGLAMRWPVFSAIVPQVVPRDQLPAALALNGISMNLSRVIGPVAAGMLISAVSPAAVFVINTVLAGVAFWLILRWRPAAKPASTLPGERFVGAMRVGLAFAMQSRRLRAVLLRIFLFFLQSTALIALLPLVARRLHGGGPGTFTVMLSCVGAGAIVAALYFPRWRERFSRDQFVWGGTGVHAAMSVLIVAVPELWLALPAMFITGMAWISVANNLSVAAQVALPDWVRARGMSIYQVALMGGSAAGSLLWGQVGSWTSVTTAVVAAAAFGVLALGLTRRISVNGGADLDFTPARPRIDGEAIGVEPDDGPVMVTVEYLVDPARADEFAAVMAQTRRARLRQGALSWGLFRDVTQPGRYVEYFVDENWLEHQRRLERFSAFDAELRLKRLAFHLGPEPPRLERYVADGLGRPPV